MKDNGLVDKKVYQLAKWYLPSKTITGVTSALIEKYMNPLSLNSKQTSKEAIYQRILESAQNANMKAGVIGRAIGGVGRLLSVLEGFNAKAVIDKYADDIVEKLKPNGAVRTLLRRPGCGVSAG